MPKFYFIHYTEKGRLPKLTPEQLEGVKKAVADFMSKNPDAKYNGTMGNPATGIAISDWDASDVGKIKDLAKSLGIPYDDAIEVEPLITP